MNLRPYIVYYAGDEWSMLVFARNRNEARTLLHKAGYADDAPYMDTRARIADTEFTRSLQQRDEPHLVDSPPGCPRCEHWNIHGRYDPCPTCESEQSK